jgi:hypothetical protein
MAKLDNTQAVILAVPKAPNRPTLVEGNATWFTLDPTATLDLMTVPLP